MCQVLENRSQQDEARMDQLTNQLKEARMLAEDADTKSDEVSRKLAFVEDELEVAEDRVRSGEAKIMELEEELKVRTHWISQNSIYVYNSRISLYLSLCRCIRLSVTLWNLWKYPKRRPTNALKNSSVKWRLWPSNWRKPNNALNTLRSTLSVSRRKSTG